MRDAQPRSWSAPLRAETSAARRLADHRVFLCLLGAGVLVRVLTQVAFRPAFLFSDGPTYLGLVDSFRPLDSRPVGYGVLPVAVSWVTRDVSAVAAVQHLLGLVTAVVIYLWLQRWGVRPVVAALATAPVLLDGMQLVLEHSALSDVLFDLLVVVAMAVLAWRPAVTPARAATAGLLLGGSVLVRVVGEPTVLVGVLFCLGAVGALRSRLLAAVLLVAAFTLPLAGYAAWYHHYYGSYRLTEAGGRALYMRTTTFVDCDRLDLPAYERPLCPAEPLGQRRDPTYYGWHDPDGDHGLTPPEGMTINQVHGDFARRAIAAQPGEYVRVVARDFLLGFAPVRGDYYEFTTSWKWNLADWVGRDATEYTRPAYDEHGGVQPHTRQPLGTALGRYGDVVYLWGPLLAVLLLLVLAGLVVPRRGAPQVRAPMLVAALLATGLTLATDVTAQFTWRYQLPMVVLLPAAAALAWTRLRAPRQLGQPGQPGTSATPSTD